MSAGPTELAASLEAAFDHHRAGRLGEAERLYRDVLSRFPGFPEVYYNLGLALQGLGKLTEAEAALRSALDARPGYPEAQTSLGNVLQAQDRPREAVALYRQALERRPDAAQIHNNLGNALKALGQLDDAVWHLEEATRLRPVFADAFYNLGNALIAQGRAGEAVSRYRRALSLNSVSAPMLNNLGSALKEQGRLDEALDCYRRALDLSPDFVDPQHNLLFCLNYRAATSPTELFEAHRDWGRRHADPVAADAPAFRNTREPERRLRVGYVSPDFHEHPVATFFEPLLGAHDPAAVESFCYAESAREDAVRERLRRQAGQWRVIRGQSSAAVAECVRADAIDILIDLAGHTARNRLGLFACRAAPVQITWLGYPATTGMAAMDYRLTDAIADPPGAEAWHSEQLLRLPSGFLCYRPPDDAPDVAPLPAEARGAVSFGSFNNFTKLSSDTVRDWARLLLSVPDSRLILKAKQSADPETVARLEGEFLACGIDRQRLVFLPPIPSLAAHLAAYQSVDIALDPFPYNGTTTSCEAMWMGVPVVTLRGDTHAARVGASLLHRVGLDDLVADTRDSYVATARDLATDRPRLTHLRGEMRGRMQDNLCDAARFAREIEETYRTVWRRWCATA